MKIYTLTEVQSQKYNIEIDNIISAHDDLLFKEVIRKIYPLSKQDIFDSIVDSFKEKFSNLNIITPLKNLSVPNCFVQNIKNKLSKN